MTESLGGSCTTNKVPLPPAHAPPLWIACPLRRARPFSLSPLTGFSRHYSLSLFSPYLALFSLLSCVFLVLPERASRPLLSRHVLVIRLAHEQLSLETIWGIDYLPRDASSCREIAEAVTRRTWNELVEKLYWLAEAVRGTSSSLRTVTMAHSRWNYSATRSCSRMSHRASFSRWCLTQCRDNRCRYSCRNGWFI